MRNKAKAICRCSFCGKTNEEVLVLIAAPTAYICNECVELAMDIVREAKADQE